jgi:hypothetical protein
VPYEKQERTPDRGLWVRRALLVLFVVLVVAALAGALGEQETTHHQTAPAATLTLEGPRRARVGDSFQAKIVTQARRPIGSPTVLLDAGWFDSIDVSSQPQASNQSGGGDGRVAWSYNAIPAGGTLTVWLSLQADASSAGDHDVGVQLLDGSRRVAAIAHTITILP